MVQYVLALNKILDHLNSFHILPSIAMSPKCSLPVRLSNQNCICICHVCHCISAEPPCSSISLLNLPSHAEKVSSRKRSCYRVSRWRLPAITYLAYWQLACGVSACSILSTCNTHRCNCCRICMPLLCRTATGQSAQEQLVLEINIMRSVLQIRVCAVVTNRLNC